VKIKNLTVDTEGWLHFYGCRLTHQGGRVVAQPEMWSGLDCAQLALMVPGQAFEITVAKQGRFWVNGQRIDAGRFTHLHDENAELREWLGDTESAGGARNGEKRGQKVTRKAS